MLLFSGERGRLYEAMVACRLTLAWRSHSDLMASLDMQLALAFNRLEWAVADSLTQHRAKRSGLSNNTTSPNARHHDQRRSVHWYSPLIISRRDRAWVIGRLGRPYSMRGIIAASVNINTIRRWSEQFGARRHSIASRSKSSLMVRLAANIDGNAWPHAWAPISRYCRSRETRAEMIGISLSIAGITPH